MQWTAMLAGARPLYTPIVQHQYAGTGAGTRAAPATFASRAVSAFNALPPSLDDVMGDLVEAPTASTLVRTVMGTVQAQEAFTVFEYACLRLVSFLLVVVHFGLLLLNLLIGGATMKINS